MPFDIAGILGNLCRSKYRHQKLESKCHDLRRREAVHPVFGRTLSNPETEIQIIKKAAML